MINPQSKNRTMTTISFVSNLKKHAPVALAVMLVFAANVAFAADGDELGDGICKVVNLLTGKWLFGISVLSMIAGGVALLFGAELTDGVKKVVTIVTIVGTMLAFSGILSMAFSRFSGVSCS